MSESNPPSATLSLRIKTLAAELPGIDLPASATVLELKRRIEEHIEIELPTSKRVRLMQQKDSDTCLELIDDSKTLESYDLADGADLSLIIESLPLFTEVCYQAKLAKLDIIAILTACCICGEQKNISILMKLDEGSSTQYLAMFAGELSLSGVNFETIGISVDSIVHELSKALISNRTITSLNLEQVKYEPAEKPYENENGHFWSGHSYFIDNRSVDLLTEALKHNTTITKVNLKNHMIKYAGVMAIIDMLKVNKTIQSLLLSCNHWMQEVQTTRLLVDAMRNRSEFTGLGIGKFQTSDLIISELLAPEMKLTQLEVDVRDDQHICNLLTTNTTVTDLELGLLRGYNRWSSLGKMISLNSTITSLNLSKNMLFEIGATELTDALKRNHSIASLILQHDKIDSTAAGNAIASLLTDNPRIVKLDLFANRMGSQGAISIIHAIANNESSVMQDLNLGQTAMTEECAAEIVMLLEKNATITKLGVSQNSLGEKGMKSICDAMMRNRTLKHIDMRKNGCCYSEVIAQSIANVHAARGDELTILRL
jgi:hypothetical protein